MNAILIIFMSRLCFPGQMKGKWSISDDSADRHRCKGKLLCFGLRFLLILFSLWWKCVRLKNCLLRFKNKVFHDQVLIHCFFFNISDVQPQTRKKSKTNAFCMFRVSPSYLPVSRTVLPLSKQFSLLIGNKWLNLYWWCK